MSQLTPSFKKQSVFSQIEPLSAVTGFGTDRPAMIADLKAAHQLLYPSLLSYVTLLLRDENEAQNLLVELFVVTCREQGVGLNPTNLKTGLFKTARVLAIDILKKTRLADLENLLFDQPVIDFIADDIEVYSGNAGQQLLLLNQLSSSEREMIYLQWYAGFDLYEISLVTGKPYENTLNLSALAGQYLSLDFRKSSC
jgi:DNA-directed RNA polymerase specialized sigma24 family protein